MDNGGDILRLCRLCLVKDDVNIPIFEEQGDIRQIFLKISSCLPVKVSREDKLPKKICDGCSYKLDMLYEFWNTTANAEKQLLSWLGEAGMNAKMADGTISAVAQQIKPVETFVKQEAIDPSDIHADDNDDDKSYMFQQKFAVEEAGPSATVTSNEEEPPPKRARRTAAVKAQIAMDPESDDDDDSGEPITKVEDESEESEGDDHEPPFVDVPSTSADDQPGPSGVGKDGVEAPCTRSKAKILKTEKKFNRIAKQVVKQKPNRRCTTEADPDFIIKEKSFPSESSPPKHKPDLDYLDKFINLNQLTEPLECKDCKLTFHSNLDFGLHSKHHTEDGFYSCHMCEYRKDSKKLIKNHIRRHDTFKCKKCKKIFISRQCAYKHSKSHLPQAPVKCEVCSKTFNNPKYLKRHHQVVHSEDTIDTVPIFFKCTKCNKQYKHAAGLKGHCSSNHRELGIDTSVICDICGKRLSCNAKLKQHLRIHTGDKPFACTVCPRKFISKDILRAHMRVHTGEKPYVCMYCGKKFSHGAPYRYHIKTHTGEKSWSCPICAKGFISKANMKIHLKTCAVPTK